MFSSTGFLAVDDGCDPDPFRGIVDGKPRGRSTVILSGAGPSCGASWPAAIAPACEAPMKTRRSNRLSRAIALGLLPTGVLLSACAIRHPGPEAGAASAPSASPASSPSSPAAPVSSTPAPAPPAAAPPKAAPDPAPPPPPAEPGSIVAQLAGEARSLDPLIETEWVDRKSTR